VPCRHLLFHPLAAAKAKVVPLYPGTAVRLLLNSAVEPETSCTARVLRVQRSVSCLRGPVVALAGQGSCLARGHPHCAFPLRGPPSERVALCPACPWLTLPTPAYSKRTAILLLPVFKFPALRTCGPRDGESGQQPWVPRMGRSQACFNRVLVRCLCACRTLEVAVFGVLQQSLQWRAPLPLSPGASLTWLGFSAPPKAYPAALPEPQLCPLSSWQPGLWNQPRDV